MSNNNTETNYPLNSDSKTENTTNKTNSLVVNKNLTLTSQNISKLTKLMPDQAINLIFPNAEREKNRGDILFKIKIPTVNSDGSLGKSQIVEKVVTKDVEYFLLKTINDSSVSVEDRKFLIGLLTIAFDQFLVNIIKKFFSSKTNKINKDDLKQQFRHGLLDAIRKYDPDNVSNARLITFAYSYFVKEYNILTNQISPVKNNTSKVSLAIRSKIFTLLSEKPEITEQDIIQIAKDLSTTRKNVVFVLNSLNAKSLNDRIGDEEGSELGDTLTDNHNLEEDVVQKDLFNNLRRLTVEFFDTKLDEKEKVIFITRILYEYINEVDIPEFEQYKKLFKHLNLSKNNSLTLEDVGKILNISAERVRQIQNDIFERYQDYVIPVLGD